MDDQLLDVYARLNLYEALLESVHAELFRNLPDSRERFEQFQVELYGRLSHRVFPPVSSFSSSLHDRSVEVAEAFCQKVQKTMGRLTG